MSDIVPIGDIVYEKQPPLAVFVEQVPTMDGVTIVGTKQIDIQDVGDTFTIEIVFLTIVLLYFLTKLK